MPAAVAAGSCAAHRRRVPVSPRGRRWTRHSPLLHSGAGGTGRSPRPARAGRRVAPFVRLAVPSPARALRAHSTSATAPGGPTTSSRRTLSTLCEVIVGSGR
jgi:hypothetical protein